MKRYILSLATCLAFVLSSCTNTNKQASEESTAVDSSMIPRDTVTAKEKEMLDFKFFYTIANLPSPMEMINAIYQNKVPFSKDLLNPASNEENYNTAYKKAVNYGIYGIDMAYAAFYGQNQDLLEYYSTTKKMAEKLNVESTFDQFTSSFRENADNKDSLVKMIDRAYAETDTYLRNNHRLEVAAHVLAGTIIEVQYLSIELMKVQERTKANEGIFDKIYNQKLYIENLINLFEELKKYPSSAKLYEDLKVLKGVFDNLKSAADLNKQEMAKLDAAVAAVRNGMIN